MFLGSAPLTTPLHNASSLVRRSQIGVPARYHRVGSANRSHSTYRREALSVARPPRNTARDDCAAPRVPDKQTRQRVPRRRANARCPVGSTPLPSLPATTRDEALLSVRAQPFVLQSPDLPARRAPPRLFLELQRERKPLPHPVWRD